MNKENAFTIVVLVAILAIFGTIYHDDRQQKRKCNDAGGIIMNDRCYETASLKIIPVQ